MPPRPAARKRPHRTPPRPRTGQPRANRAEKKDATRQRIASAALQLFQSSGFDATTTKAIARKAGIAEGTVFNYFRTKDDIALHFFEEEVDHAIDSVRNNARLANAPLEEKLFALIQRQLEFLAPHERFIGSAFMEALKPSSKLGLSHRALALRYKYIAFVEELMETSLTKKRFNTLRWWAPEAFWVFYLATLVFWLHDTSEGKQKTLALLDRALNAGVAMLRRSV